MTQFDIVSTNNRHDALNLDFSNPDIFCGLGGGTGVLRV